METKNLRVTQMKICGRELYMQVSKLSEDHKGKMNRIRAKDRTLGNIHILTICHLNTLRSEY